MQDNSKKYSYLDKVNSPFDLKALKNEEIAPLCQDIREFLIEKVSEHGGHLASNLGVVETTVAIHRVFDSPRDHIIWDVGHQSYVHKILTGRKDGFDTLRESGGLSGFTKREESEHDAFGAGHSSTSISAALGFAEADKLNGSDAYTVAIVGDGAFTGGMIHEALNNCEKNLKLIIIINENEMSISKNIGRFATRLTKIRRSRGYFKTKATTGRILNKIPLIGHGLFCAVRDAKQFLKNAMYGSNYFENLGIYYLGPVDGSDEEAVEALLTEAKRLGESCVIHIKTKKGKGYAPAEENPSLYHGMPKAELIGVKKYNFSRRFGELLCAAAKKDKDICAVTAAMESGTGLDDFHEAYPDRFFDVGIAEEHALTFAAGLAAEGKKPIVAIYSTFLQRGYDSIIHDIALQNLPVTMCIDRAGLNRADGATHHGIFDVAFLSHIPNVKIYTPATFGALERAMKAAMSDNCPVAIRYPNAVEPERVRRVFYPENDKNAPLGIRTNFSKEEKLDAVIITHGRIVSEALLATDILRERGKNVGVILCEYIKPYDRLADEVEKVLPMGDLKIVTLEEEIRAGGFGMLLCDKLSTREIMRGKSTIILGTDDNFAIQRTNEPIYKTVGISAEDIVDRILN